MTTRHGHRWLIPLFAAAVVAGCSGPSPHETSRTSTPSTTDPIERNALAAYEEFWTVTDAAFAAPGSQDWTSRTREVATGQALQALDRDIANYSGVPAHTEGTVSRAPKVATVAAERVAIVDCVDISGSRLVSDDDGQVLDDLANRVPRYLYRAEVIPRGDRWVVDRTAPSLAEPC
ncbi:hypothetical protein EV383_2441 [Pseudonocardia sediminis]|uniref:Mce-associated membrane protein n=1 Tax=Pseudonocardia sediminis TaxID=1397368 RepID=A0A4Q7UX14_PSEST|nr:hypothetical protein [Pseudonocardia sediminis]RZT85568.1 hypothetical protein EV383_2441 [Pseudonocardia sediminis]